MKKKEAMDRLANVDPARVEQMPESASPWHETGEEIEEKLREGAEKKAQLEWLQRQITRRLTDAERRCVRAYYMKGMTFREAADKFNMTPSTVYRTVQRGLRKLRKDAPSRYGRYRERRH